MKKSRFGFMLALTLIIAFLAGSYCYAGVADFTRSETKQKSMTVVAVGSYGGYWGLNGYFIAMLDDYFTLDQMLSIDQQIQTISGISSLGYNYNGEQCWGSYGYLYNPSTGTWSYYTGGIPGKNYMQIYDMGFYIDVDTGEVIGTFTSSGTVSGGYANLIGANVNIGGESYQVIDARNWSPILLDLKGDGIPDVNRKQWLPHAPKFFSERTSYFDLGGDGRQVYCEWLGTKDGLLVKPNANGSVTSARNLFGTAGGYNNGYEKMAETLDSDKNGYVEGAELEGLCVWIDKNTNGICDKGELSPIENFKITKISVNHNKFKSTYVRNGKEYATWDWWPAGYEVMKRK